jgi:SAM-dependent methyltransferase
MRPTVRTTHYDRPAVLAALGPVAGRQILDAACGPGLYLRELLERGAEVTAFDASPVMVALARRQAAGRARNGQPALGKPRPVRDSSLKSHRAGPRRNNARPLSRGYEKLSREPGFLILRLLKPTGASAHLLAGGVQT